MTKEVVKVDPVTSDDSSGSSKEKENKNKDLKDLKNQTDELVSSLEFLYVNNSAIKVKSSPFFVLFCSPSHSHSSTYNLFFIPLLFLV